MLLHEYQAKELLLREGIPVLPGGVAETPESARKVAERIGGTLWAIKAQVHAGGRGKAGGIRLARSLEEVEEIARKLLGTVLVTHQTGPRGRPVEKLYIEGGCDIKKELYVAFTLDRKESRYVLIVSEEGGVEIEEVAKTHPEKIHRYHLHPFLGLLEFSARNLSFRLFPSREVALTLAGVLKKLSHFSQKYDTSLLEINPLVITHKGEVYPLDAKVDIDDNALFRHPELKALEDLHQLDPREQEARKWNVNYIGLSGTVGCLVNGAGLAMATMDTIHYFGGEPANFLDVGGGATKEQVTQAFKILSQDRNVKAILVNIFGGIMRCDTIAEGIVAAVKEVGLSVPLVVRLEGTNVELGRKILKESGLPIETAESLAEGARKAVALAKGVQ